MALGLLSPGENQQSYVEDVYLLNRGNHAVTFHGYTLSRKIEFKYSPEIIAPDLTGMLCFVGTSDSCVLKPGEAYHLRRREIAKKELAFDTLSLHEPETQLKIARFEARGSPFGRVGPAFDEDTLCLALINSLEAPLWHETASDTLKRGSAQNLYGFLFEYWLVCESSGRSVNLHGGAVPRIVEGVTKYVELPDPLRILPSYPKDGVLSPAGRQVVGILPLNDAEELFSLRADYERSVASFRSWLLRAGGKNGVPPQTNSDK